jgi:hypothetical protein
MLTANALANGPPHFGPSVCAMDNGSGSDGLTFGRLPDVHLALLQLTCGLMPLRALNGSSQDQLRHWRLQAI